MIHSELVVKLWYGSTFTKWSEVLSLFEVMKALPIWIIYIPETISRDFKKSWKENSRPWNITETVWSDLFMRPMKMTSFTDWVSKHRMSNEQNRQNEENPAVWISSFSRFLSFDILCLETQSVNDVIFTIFWTNSTRSTRQFFMTIIFIQKSFQRIALIITLFILFLDFLKFPWFQFISELRGDMVRTCVLPSGYYSSHFFAAYEI